MDKVELTFAVLNFKRLRHPHNASVLQRSISDLLDFYDINDKVLTITADGASNNNASI